VEGVGKVDGGGVKSHLSGCGPKIESIPLGLTVGMEAAEHVAVEIDGEVASRGVCSGSVVKRTGTAALRT
jgi:hypothetical protein